MPEDTSVSAAVERRESFVESERPPIECYNLDAMLYEHGFVRIAAKNENKRFYHCFGRQLGFGRRECRRLATMMEETLTECYNSPSYKRKADAHNDRFRLLSHMFRCSITIFGAFDLKSHRRFSSGNDIRSMMFLDVGRGCFQLLIPAEEAVGLIEPLQSPYPNGVTRNQDDLCGAFSAMRLTPAVPGYENLPLYFPQLYNFDPRLQMGDDDVFN